MIFQGSYRINWGAYRPFITAWVYSSEKWIKFSLGEILHDLRMAEDVLRKFERRYWITSEQFFELYNQGVWDNVEHAEILVNGQVFISSKSGAKQHFRS